MNLANVGDIVWIYDYNSDLFIFKGEIIDIINGQALVMIEEHHNEMYRCIVDTFNIDDLEIRFREKKAV